MTVTVIFWVLVVGAGAGVWSVWTLARSLRGYRWGTSDRVLAAGLTVALLTAVGLAGYTGAQLWLVTP